MYLATKEFCKCQMQGSPSPNSPLHGGRFWFMQKYSSPPPGWVHFVAPGALRALCSPPTLSREPAVLPPPRHWAQPYSSLCSPPTLSHEPAVLPPPRHWAQPYSSLWGTQSPSCAQANRTQASVQTLSPLQGIPARTADLSSHVGERRGRLSEEILGAPLNPLDQAVPPPHNLTTTE